MAWRILLDGLPARLSISMSVSCFNAAGLSSLIYLFNHSDCVGCSSKHYNKSEYKWIMVELKLGKVNKMLGEIIEAGRVEDSVVSGFDKVTKDQLNRMVKQKERTGKIEKLVKENKGIDVKTGIHITLGEHSFRWKFWNTILEDALRGAKEKQVCLCTVEDCFMIFASTLSDIETFHFFYDIIYGVTLSHKHSHLKYRRMNKNILLPHTHHQYFV